MSCDSGSRVSEVEVRIRNIIHGVFHRGGRGKESVASPRLAARPPQARGRNKNPMLVHHRRRSRYSRDRVLCVGASQLRAATISQGHMARGRSDDAAGAVRGAFR